MKQQPLIAVVDDDPNIRELVEAYLRKEQYATVGVGSAEEALQLWRSHEPDMWVLDIMLPGMDGYTFLRRVRQEAEVPIIMISAKDAEVDRVLGLELGGDDYLVKPFSLRELVARVKRQLHRWQAAGHPAEHRGQQSLLEAGRLKLMTEERRVFWNGMEADVTMKEFELLKTLAEHPNRAFTREELLVKVWGDDYYGSDRAVDHLIKRVRKKLEQVPIEAVWGHGYRLRTEEGGAGDEAGTSD
ncbi:response regulator transcription factor [Gorillibacterium sp. sgz5001074]|uniref:response regulator transcription factor n=1 Tax=Gorillibacterium sp. sgz5001074 TaxID=3446695 RepID=UPI003F678E6D